MNQLYLINFPYETGYGGVFVVSAISAVEAYFIAYDYCASLMGSFSTPASLEVVKPKLERQIYTTPFIIGTTERPSGVVYAYSG